MSAELKGPRDLQGEADAYEFLEQLRWGPEGPQDCPHCGSDRGAWFLKSKDPEGRKSKGGSSAKSHRRVWKCRDSQCRRQFSVLTNTVMHGTKMPVRSWVEVIYALCSDDAGLSARDIASRWGVAEKSSQLMLSRIQQALEWPEVAGASLAGNAPLWVRVQTPKIETTAHRAAASAARRYGKDADNRASAQVKVDVARAFAEALGEPEAAAPAPDRARAPEPMPVAKIERAAQPLPVAKPDPEFVAGIQPRIDQEQVEADVYRVFAELAQADGLVGEGWLDTSAETSRRADSHGEQIKAEDEAIWLGPSWASDSEPDSAPTHSPGQLDLFDSQDEHE